MNPSLELLIQIQEIDLMVRELGDEKTATAEKKLGFSIKNLDTLRATREELAKKVDPGLMRRYQRVQEKHFRAVVPMRDGVCFGCFVRQPAMRGLQVSPTPQQVEGCQHCGRILFRIALP